MPWVVRCERIRDVPLPGPSGSAPQTHGLRPPLIDHHRTQSPARGRLPVTRRFLCRFFWWEQREKHPAKLKILVTPHCWRDLKIAFFLFFGRKVWRTILSRRSSRLSRTSRAPSRLSRPRPIDCDREPEQTVKNYPVFGQFCFRTSSTKSV